MPFHASYRPTYNYTTAPRWPRYITTHNSTGRRPGYNSTYIPTYNTTTSSPSTDGNFTSLPSQCTSPKTVNLTESWRNNYPRKGPLHSDTGTYDEGRTWFRFTGKAGSQLKNICPKQYSCGSSGAYWSDDPMPSTVGGTLDFYMYESYHNTKLYECKTNQRKFKSQATLCSPDGDYVYLLEGKMSGKDDTLCGMYKS